MARRRRDVKRIFERIRIRRSPELVYPPRITDAELDKLEAQLGSRLPHSYRVFMKRFGPGELQNWVCLHSIASKRERARRTVTGRTTELRGVFGKHPNWYPNHEWLTKLVYFAIDGGGNVYAWAPDTVTQSRPFECRFYCLPRLEEEHPRPAGESFRRFIGWVETDLRTLHPEMWDGSGRIYFTPAHCRAKKGPLKRDVKRWLAWNNGTVRDLARSIREQGREDAFPVLADALEEAGCTNGDLLNSCRSGLPDSDGTWVLGVLLGAK